MGFCWSSFQLYLLEMCHSKTHCDLVKQMKPSLFDHTQLSTSCRNGSTIFHRLAMEYVVKFDNNRLLIMLMDVH